MQEFVPGERLKITCRCVCVRVWVGGGVGEGCYNVGNIPICSWKGGALESNV